MRLHLARAIGVAALVFLTPALGHGHETDQFRVPPGRQFADLGDYFNRWAYSAIDEGVRHTNAEIRAALDQKQDECHLSVLQSAPHVTMAVRGHWPWSVTQIEDFEHTLTSERMRDRYPGRVVAWGDRFGGEYQFAFLPFDIRQLAHILFFSSTVKIYGTYVGTDKFGHFTDEGISYYFAWREARDKGIDEKRAVAAAVRLGTDGIMSEAGLLGLAANADYANGDVAANFAGFLFYRNLTEPMSLKGEVYPPLLERDGRFWRLAKDCRPDSGFFARFVSDHLDEALNPGFFDPICRPGMRLWLRGHRDEVLQHYCGDDRHFPRTREWFDHKLREVTTYWGIDYGHMGSYDELVSIGSECFDTGGGPADAPAEPVLVAAGRRAERSSPLADRASVSVHESATSRRPTAERFADPSARDAVGRTSLHEAAARGDASMVRQFLKRSRDVGSPDGFGVTPLHLACRNGHFEVAEELLAHGADANAVTAAGATPLHEAAVGGDAAIVKALLARGANPRATDRRGRTAAAVAREHGFLDAAALIDPTSASTTTPTGARP